MAWIVLLAGMAVALVTVLGIHISNTRNSPWAYPLTLSLYPLFYLGFALHAGDSAVFTRELLVALPFFALCLIAARRGLRYSGYLLAAGYIAHGVYDGLHDRLFINPGAPAWWPLFCGSIDVLIGLYLLALSARLPGQAIVPPAKSP